MTRRHAIPFRDNDPRLYFGDQGTVTQSFVEANIKRGTQWFIEKERTHSGEKNYLFKTGKLPVIIKYVLIDSDDRIRLRLMEKSNH